MEIQKPQLNPENKPSTPRRVFFPKHQYLWLVVAALLLIVIVASVYWWKEIKETNESQSQLCSQITTTAKNPETGEVKIFSSSCEIPKGWVEVNESYLILYFKDKTSENDILSLKSSIEQQSWALSVTYLSQQEAVDSFKANHSDDAFSQSVDELASLGDNPFGAILSIKLKTSADKDLATSFIESQQINSRIESIRNSILPIQIKTDNNMSDWKTYTNTEYGFEFKYPNNWNVETIPVYENDPGVITAISSLSGNSYVIGPEVPNKNSPKTLTELKNSLNRPDGNYSTTAITFAGEPAFESIINLNQPHEERYVHLLHNGYHYWIQKSSENVNDQGALDQILSSFRFIDQAITEWQTYQNTKVGFEFKYPKHWSYKIVEGATDTEIVAIIGRISSTGEGGVEFISVHNIPKTFEEEVSFRLANKNETDFAEPFYESDREIIFANQKAHEFIYGTAIGLSEGVIIVKSSPTLMIFVRTPGGYNFPATEDILNSFKIY